MLKRKKQETTEKMKKTYKFRRYVYKSESGNWEHSYLAGLVFTSNNDVLPANTRHQPDVELMLYCRLRRWPNISPASGRPKCLPSTVLISQETRHLDAVLD